MKKIVSYLRKKRAISPVIATVLLIGLVVVAGLGVAIVMFGTINAPEPIKIEYLSISSFETTDEDYNVDRFEVTIHNIERTNIRIESDAFTLSYLNGTEIPSWYMDLDQSEIKIPALSIETIPLACDNSLNEFELVPQNTTIRIETIIYPAESNDPRLAKTIRSDVLNIGDTVGPVNLRSHTASSTFDQSGLTLNFSVTNNGTSDLDLRLDFSTDSFNKVFYIIDGINSTSHSFKLNGLASTTFQDSHFEINATSLASYGESFLVLVTLWNENNMKLLASETFILYYEL